MSSASSYFAAGLALALVACGGTSFSGESTGAAPAAPKPGKDGGDSEGEDADARKDDDDKVHDDDKAEASDHEDAPRTEIKDVADASAKPEPEKVALTELSADQNYPSISKCLANLSVDKVDVKAVGNVKVLEAAGMSPFVNQSIIDDEVTDYDRVVVVKMSGFGPVVNFDMNLLNPRGIYCIISDSFSVFTNRKITMCKEAKVATENESDMHLFNEKGVLKVGC